MRLWHFILSRTLLSFLIINASHHPDNNFHGNVSRMFVATCGHPMTQFNRVSKLCASMFERVAYYPNRITKSIIL